MSHFPLTWSLPVCIRSPTNPGDDHTCGLFRAVCVEHSLPDYLFAFVASNLAFSSGLLVFFSKLLNACTTPPAHLSLHHVWTQTLVLEPDQSGPSPHCPLTDSPGQTLLASTTCPAQSPWTPPLILTPTCPQYWFCLPSSPPAQVPTPDCRTIQVPVHHVNSLSVLSLICVTRLLTERVGCVILRTLQLASVFPASCLILANHQARSSSLNEL